MPEEADLGAIYVELHPDTARGSFNQHTVAGRQVATSRLPRASPPSPAGAIAPSSAMLSAERRLRRKSWTGSREPMSMPAAHWLRLALSTKQRICATRPRRRALYMRAMRRIRDLEPDATEIRTKAERRLGEVIAEQKLPNQ